MELPGYDYIIVYKDIHFGRPFIAGTLIRPENVLYELAKDKTFDEVSKAFYNQINFKQIRECIKYAIDVMKILKYYKKVKPKVPRRLKRKLGPTNYTFIDKDDDNNSSKYDPKIKNSSTKVVDVLNKLYEGKEISQVAEELNIPKEAVIESILYSASLVDDFHLSLSAFEDPASVVIESFNYIRKKQ
ncbi:DUF433 domain-containing protein [Saccharolobus solfataricus]|uniref:DUF433 domain-containing protein n=3 Tax=Saccharolobus solfataricus TaxID=2287 RepID=Q97V98_SACS2|nr:DUF433 domain-containing protein [Saccharolobus solfataricus]AAK42847.1 Hypothetical protein SSO2736 [Saccharolobus solfataricus P2]AKA72938.1 DUF433 domain-containing protein [Saccharolobus solfataricus]AKA75637.1 DUF433 domain-containing protein [Saccharolobus solfataricus]AKA78330.1 DUF433 domain-containing protein [Saccharolobus solfataricus]AZF67449.1 DUF433 domain-containing protein [Saccharolobus solfataricus]